MRIHGYGYPHVELRIDPPFFLDPPSFSIGYYGPKRFQVEAGMPQNGTVRSVSVTHSVTPIDVTSRYDFYARHIAGAPKTSLNVDQAQASVAWRPCYVETVPGQPQALAIFDDETKAYAYLAGMQRKNRDTLYRVKPI